jgi:hypothetical protein
MSTYSQYSFYSCWIEVNNGAVCAMGQQADILTNQIQSAMGQSGTPSIPGGIGTDYVSLLVIGAVLYLALPFLLASRRY